VVSSAGTPAQRRAIFPCGAEWCRMAHHFTPLPTMTERTRFTIACDVDVYEAVADLAHVSGVSMSRCIGDWLRDTAEAAQMTAIRVNEVRKSPEEALRAYTAATARAMPEMLDKLDRTAWGSVRRSLGLAGPGERGGAGATEGRPLRRGSGTGAGSARAGVPAKPAPPSSNTGGKSPGKTLGSA
jgi:hypothetical protein